MRYELVDGQGNFGSIDDDPPAAMRYCVVGDTRVCDAGRQRADRGSRRRPGARQRARRRARRARSPRAARCTPRGSFTPAITRRCGCARARATRSPAPTTIRCCASSTWSASRCFMWKFLDELAPGDRVLISRTPRAARSTTSATTSARSPSCSGAFVAEGFVEREVARASTTSTTTFFDRVLAAYDHHVGGRRYVYERTIRSGSRLRELDIQDMTSLRASPLACPDRPRQPGQARPRAGVARLGGVQARVPAGAVRGRWLVVAAAPQHDPGLLLVLQRAARRRGAAVAARVRRHQPDLRADRRAASTRSSSPTAATRGCSRRASGSSASSRRSCAATSRRSRWRAAR